MLTLEAAPGRSKVALLRSKVVPVLNVILFAFVPPFWNTTLPLRLSLLMIFCIESVPALIRVNAPVVPPVLRSNFSDANS